MVVQRNRAWIAPFFYLLFLSVVMCQAGASSPAASRPTADEHVYAPLRQMLTINRRTVSYEQQDHTTNNYLEYVQLIQKIFRDAPFSEQHQAAINLVGKNVWFNQWAQAQGSVSDETQTWRDLELFCGKPGNENKYLGGTLQRAQSHIGAKCSLALLACPVVSGDDLMRRQAVVRAIVNDAKLQGLLMAERDVFKAAELSLLHTSSSCDPLDTGVRWRQLYQISVAQWLNRSSLALYLRQKFYSLQSSVGVGMSAALGITFLVYALHELGVLRGTRATALRTRLERDVVSVSGNFSNSSDWYDRIIWRGLNRYPRLKGVQTCLAAFSGYLTLSYLRRTLEDLYAEHLFNVVLHEVMCHIAQLIRSGKRLQQLIQHHLVLADCKELEPIRDFFERDLPASKSLQELCALCDTATFNYAQELMPTHMGRVIRAQVLFSENKETIFTLCASLGFVDAYLGIAQLYQEHRDTPATFCFPTFLAADKPLLAVEEVWHPYVEPSKAVVNTLTLGGEGGVRQALFTGPNTAGKSTFLKSVALAAYLAQGWGIVPAKSCTLTPFDIIETSLNITDDTAKGNSLFKQEVLRNGLLLERADQLPVGKYGAFFFDEMYNGTTPLEGIACAYSTAEGFIKRERALSMVATHFDLLTELPELYPNCANYHFSVDPIQATEATSNKRFNCTFQVRPGSSHQHVALEILEEEGVASDVLASARAILKRLEAGQGKGIGAQ